MLDWLARSLLRRRVLVLVAAVAVVGAAGVLGAGVVSKLRSGGFEDPAASSTRAQAALRDSFHTGEPNLVLLVTADGGTVDQARLASGGLELTRRLAAERDVSEVQSYWTTKAPQLRSTDGRQALVLARIAGDDDATQKRAGQLATGFERDQEGMRVQVGGQARVFGQVSDQVERDLTRAEGIAVPITLLLLVVVFSSAVAGALPLAVGGFAIVGTLLVLRLLASLTDVSVYALNLTTALGLGLAIDYSMFIVSRYREELRAGQEPADALVTTMRTAGRTVLFSAATVAVALVALLVFPLYFLRSFGYAGIAVVALAAVGALVVLPALLAVLGRRVGAGAGSGLGGVAPDRDGGDAAAGADRDGGGGGAAGAGRALPRRALRPAGRPGAADLRQQPPGGRRDSRRLHRPRRRRAAGGGDRHRGSGRCSRRDRRLRQLPVRPARRRQSRRHDRQLRRRPQAGLQAAGHGPGTRLHPGTRLRSGAGTRLRSGPGRRRTGRRPVRGGERDLAAGGADGGGLFERRREPGRAGASAAGAVRGRRRRPLGTAGRYQGRDQRPAAACRGDHRRRDPATSVPDDRQPGHPHQGPGPQPAVALRRLRRDGLRLPGRPPVRPARLHLDRHDRHLDAGAAVVHRLRPLHGLRGVPALRDQGGVRPHRGHGLLCGHRPGAERPHRDHAGGAAGDRVHRVRDLAGHLPEAVRDRQRAGDRGRRHPDPRAAGAGVHAAGRQSQ